MGRLFLRCRWVRLAKPSGIPGNFELAIRARRSAIAGPRLSPGRTDRRPRRGGDAFLRLLAHAISCRPAHCRKANCSESSSCDRDWRTAAILETLLPESVVKT